MLENFIELGRSKHGGGGTQGCIEIQLGRKQPMPPLSKRASLAAWPSNTINGVSPSDVSGSVLLEINGYLPIPVALEMDQGCPASDAWLLLTSGMRDILGPFKWRDNHQEAVKLCVGFASKSKRLAARDNRSSHALTGVMPLLLECFMLISAAHA
ncbi:hypothetical protein QJS10_CPA16g00668 [Acorus calamus]|uniref:Uncharacterized protein n=1 Tax=Acorus calamus TaxID=4465 RepID=A0AAV9D3J5_ACOCL|nr:hypothetical protein QJS10_CPA16g00668 [Acorus calamus]